MSWLHGVTAQRACPRSAPRPPVRTCSAPWRSPAPHLQEGGSACSPGEVTMQTGIRGWRKTEVTCGLKGAPSALQPLPPAVATPTRRSPSFLRSLLSTDNGYVSQNSSH